MADACPDRVEMNMVTQPIEAILVILMRCCSIQPSSRRPSTVYAVRTKTENGSFLSTMGPHLFDADALNWRSENHRAAALAPHASRMFAESAKPDQTGRNYGLLANLASTANQPTHIG